jgi:hypothetical protein
MSLAIEFTAATRKNKVDGQVCKGDRRKTSSARCGASKSLRLSHSLIAVAARDVFKFKTSTAAHTCSGGVPKMCHLDAPPVAAAGQGFIVFDQSRHSAMLSVTSLYTEPTCTCTRCRRRDPQKCDCHLAGRHFWTPVRNIPVILDHLHAMGSQGSQAQHTQKGGRTYAQRSLNHILYQFWERH